MKKKLYVLTLAGVMAASLIGCGSTSTGTTAGEKAAQAEASQQKEITAEKMNHETKDSGKEDTPATDGNEKQGGDNEMINGQDIPGGDGEMLSGGWSAADSMKITEQHLDMFKKAQETLTGAYYTPLALLSTQVVAGTNYRFLCRMDASVAELNATPYYAIVEIYEDLQGNASISQITDSEVPAPSSDGMMVGAYAQPEDLAMTPEATKAFELATKTITGMEYKAAALLGSQVVAGTNYRILCEAKASTAGSETGWAILTIYADLQGNAEITEIAEMK